MCTFTGCESTGCSAVAAQYHLQMNVSDVAFTGRMTAVFVPGDEVQPSGAGEQGGTGGVAAVIHLGGPYITGIYRTGRAPLKFSTRGEKPTAALTGSLRLEDFFRVKHGKQGCRLRVLEDVQP